MSERNKLVAAVYLLLLDGQKVLMLRRFNTGYQDGTYSLVSGHIDAGESARTAMVREAKEEAGIDLRSEDLEFIHVMNRPSAERDSERLELFFTCEKWQGEITNMEPGKCDDMRWFKLDALPSPMAPEVAEGVQMYKEGRYYSEMNWN